VVNGIDSPLKVGLLVSSLSASPENIKLARWAAAHPRLDASIILIALDPPPSDSSRSFRHRLTQRLLSLWKQDHKALAMHVAIQMKEAIYNWQVKGPDSSSKSDSESADCESSLDEILPIVHIFEPVVSPSGFVHRLTDDDLTSLIDSEYDILVRLGNGILRGGILTASKHGILSFHHGDNRVNRGGPWGFWEVLEQADSTGFVLQRLTNELDGGEVLIRRNYTTARTVLRNRANLIRRSYPLLREVLLDLAETNELPTPEPPFPYTGRLYRTPTVKESLRFAIPNLRGILKSITYRLLVRSHQEWHVGVLNHHWMITSFRNSRLVPKWHVGVLNHHWMSASFRNSRLVPTHPGTWVADPFIVSWAGQRCLFVEEFVEAEGKGHISVCSLDESGSPSLPIKIISEEFHLSFPWTFTFNGVLYMTPESANAREIRLYRCVDFPYAWEFVGPVMTEVSAVDPMIFEHEDKWYMLVNIDPLNAGDLNSELHVFIADDPVEGDWEPILGSPSVVDPRQARNGGLVRDRDRLFRIGQRQVYSQYGRACGVYEVVRIGIDGYSEKLVFPLEAEWEEGLRGMHHLSSDGGITAFDFLI
jgi:hypothetical protein